ncbi:MAG TPA: hypothetical protein PL144_08965, partial [Accumulibacter sp.]|nr:hypothetical protein [Accumulibacter sp.]
MLNNLRIGARLIASFALVIVILVAISILAVVRMNDLNNSINEAVDVRYPMTALGADAMQETLTILDVYARFAEEFMAMPVIKGVKTANERFAGADETFCIEALMQDGKALQAGTSHFLGQNFAKAFDVLFLNKDN